MRTAVLCVEDERVAAISVQSLTDENYVLTRTSSFGAAAGLSRCEIAHIVARCVADTELANLTALLAELVAIGEYLADPLASKPGCPESLALDPYLSAGGTRAGFRRSWATMVGDGIPPTVH